MKRRMPKLVVAILFAIGALVLACWHVPARANGSAAEGSEIPFVEQVEGSDQAAGSAVAEPAGGSADHVHVWDEGTQIMEATVTEAGEMSYVCTECGQTKTEVVPATGYTVVFELAGGTLNGSDADLVYSCAPGEEISVPAAPLREGYDFLFWAGTELAPGDTMTVEGDATFTAQWAPTDAAATGGRGDGSNPPQIPTVNPTTETTPTTPETTPNTPTTPTTPASTPTVPKEENNSLPSTGDEFVAASAGAFALSALLLFVASRRLLKDELI